ncbi:hypothetical protein [Heyndrickxia sporothermodurans]|uniref:hypothetical protein n=1 Tax=Heyndrickxia sporothermodurans TaxID=46224 RepID=UPI002E1F9D24|nr:hypothetical protein [Heyndrickxia sporothermodurans]MED3697942.1 hypothetical protein [Heyndrickxia sporothermodurans]
MAKQNEIAERLLKRFKGVPNYTINDATDIVGDSMQVHGYSLTADVPDDQVTIILLYAQAEGALQIALATAHYFSYTDGEEAVDKSKVSDQYRKLASDLRGEYMREKNANNGTNFRVMRRLDR